MVLTNSVITSSSSSLANSGASSSAAMTQATQVSASNAVVSQADNSTFNTTAGDGKVISYLNGLTAIATGWNEKLSSPSSAVGEVNAGVIPVSTACDGEPVLFAPKADTTVNTAFGSVRMDEGSLVLVLSFADGLAVYNLDDTHRGSVKVSVSGKDLSVNPGAALIVCGEQIREFEQINPAQLVAYRDVSGANLGSGLKAFNAEFSVASAINAVPALQHLLRSKNRDAMKLTAHFLKTTAAANQMKAGRAAYHQVVRPQATAWGQP
jgi:hypothetical protein